MAILVNLLIYIVGFLAGIQTFKQGKRVKGALLTAGAFGFSAALFFKIVNGQIILINHTGFLFLVYVGMVNFLAIGIEILNGGKRLRGGLTIIASVLLIIMLLGQILGFWFTKLQ